jgi:hypothetical protein
MHNGRILKFFCLAVFLGACGWIFARPWAAESGVGKVTFLIGSAEVKKGTSAWAALSVGSVVGMGDQIRTAKKAREPVAHRQRPVSKCK